VPYAHTLGLGEALRVAGVKGGEVPAIEARVIPVMVLADFSRTYSAEPFESRAFAAARSISPAGTRFWMRLQSRSPGGLVVEDIRISLSVITVGFCFVDVVQPFPVPVVENPVTILQTGGGSTRSSLFIGWTTAAPSGTGPVDMGGLIVGANPLATVPRFHVPPGFNLIFFGEQIGQTQAEVSCTWREIPEPIGVP